MQRWRACLVAGVGWVSLALLVEHFLGIAVVSRDQHLQPKLCSAAAAAVMDIPCTPASRRGGPSARAACPAPRWQSPHLEVSVPASMCGTTVEGLGLRHCMANHVRVGIVCKQIGRARIKTFQENIYAPLGAGRNTGLIVQRAIQTKYR